MTIQPNEIPIYTGCLYGNPADGDIAAQEEQTTLCQRATSIKVYPQLCDDKPKPSGGASSQGWEDGPNQHSTPKSRKATTCTTTVENSQGQNRAGPSTRPEQGCPARKGRIQADSINEAGLERLQKKTNEIWNGINKKQGYKFATLNIRGKNDMNKKSKWPTIATMMRKKRIMIMGVQETHLNEEETEKIRKMCPGIEVINNGEQTAKEGVAFVLNKELTKEMTWSHKKIIEGRASKMTIQIKNEEKMDLVVVYAPNTDRSKREFFEKLCKEMEKDKYEKNVVVMGDFNCVENKLDRYPHRKDDNRVISEWKNIKRKYKLIDGWRAQDELGKGYTYTQPESKSMSRIDRIYVNDEIYPYGYNWDHQDAAKISDHEIATVEILKKGLPHIGKGLWRMQPEDMDDERIKEKTSEVLRRAEKRMKQLKEKNEEGIQELWMMTKNDIKEIVKGEKKKRSADLTRKRKRIRNKIEKLMKELKSKKQTKERKIQEKIAILKEKLAKKSEKEINKMRESAKARYREKGEKYTKYWFKLNAVGLESQIILRLQKQDGQLTKETKEMMKVALEHHRKLQERPEMNQERQKAIDEPKTTIEARIKDKEQRELKKMTGYEEIEEAIRRAPNGKSPGVDGIIYEFYKEKVREHERDNEKPDMIGILHMMVEDIEKRGLIERPEGKKTKIYGRSNEPDI
jgi:exonuclease III